MMCNLSQHDCVEIALVLEKRESQLEMHGGKLHDDEVIKSKISESRPFAYVTIVGVIVVIAHQLWVIYYLSQEYLRKLESLNFASYANFGVSKQRSWVPGGIIVCFAYCCE